MTIFKNGVKQEDVELHPIKTKQELHALFQSKGFVKKSAEELEKDQKRDKTNDEAFNLMRERKYQRERAGGGLPSARRKRLMEERELRNREEQYLGASAMLPSYITMFGLYGAAAIALFSAVACTRSRRK